MNKRWPPVIELSWSARQLRTRKSAILSAALLPTANKDPDCKELGTKDQNPDSQNESERESQLHK